MCHIYNRGKSMSAYEIKDWRLHFEENKDSPNTFLKAMLVKEGPKLSERIVDSLNYAITEDVEETVILQLNSDIPILITVRNSEYHVILNTILDYFVEQEYYEECVLIRDLLNKIINETKEDKSRRETSATKIQKN